MASTANEVPTITISNGGEDLEQLCPLQRRRTSPRIPSLTTVVGTPESPYSTSSRYVSVGHEASLEIRDEAPVTSVQARDEVHLDYQGPS